MEMEGLVPLLSKDVVDKVPAIFQKVLERKHKMRLLDLITICSRDIFL